MCFVQERHIVDNYNKFELFTYSVCYGLGVVWVGSLPMQAGEI